MTCGWLYFSISQSSDAPVASWGAGIYIVLTMSVLNPIVDYPSNFILQLFFYLMPVIGIGILAQGLTDFGVLFFNRRSRGKEWEIAVASTYSNHIILIGLGHLGFRVVKILHEMGEDVVVVSLDPDPNLALNVRAWGIPVIEGDGSREVILENACIRQARSIILCTQNDSLNLQIALKARSMNADIEVVIRIFDDDFAVSLQRQFGYRALSATGMAAPIFASSAANVDITPPITIDGRPNSLARLCVSRHSGLIKMTLGEIEDKFNVSVVLLCRGTESDSHPSAKRRAEVGDTLAILGDPQAISNLVHENQT